MLMKNQELNIKHSQVREPPAHARSARIKARRRRALNDDQRQRHKHYKRN
jgi:hypothetical protein